MNPDTATLEDRKVETGEDSTESRAPAIALRFAAGEGDDKKATHGSIERVLKEIGLSEHQRSAVHFGNWLRDYSQLLDPKIVRATTMPKSFPDVLSREALTKIVDILAVREFTGLMQADRESFRVTPERLGVYRPSEHIDNPKVIDPSPVDPHSRDAEFEPWTTLDDPLLQVDYQTSMKGYLQRSVTFMTSRLHTAASKGIDSTDGLQAFGSGLHVLEDFFAHSNFVELSLIKLGHKDVLPWTSKADCKHELPLVTGMFGSTDVIASLAEPLGKILFSTQDAVFTPTQSGARYEKDQIIQILLSEHPNPSYLGAFEDFLQVRDKWAELPFARAVELINHHLSLPGQLVGNAINAVMQGVLTLVGNSIGDAQTRFVDDPNTSGSTDPTHSQLAKDHAEHPLHDLAAILARHAVLNVGRTLSAQWQGNPGSDAASVAADYFAHPMDTEWQDTVVRNWAIRYPEKVRQATQKSQFSELALDLQKHSMGQLEQLITQGGKFLHTFLGTGSLLRLWELTPIGSYLIRKK